MAGPFDVSPPSWLVASVNQPTPEPSPAAGVAFGSLFNMLKKNPETGKNYTFGEAQAVGRLNAQDPLWQPKWELTVQQKRLGMLGDMAQMESTMALAREREAETKAWMQDAPVLSPWLTATPEQRKEMPRPTAVSKQGMQILAQVDSRDSFYDIRKAQVDNQTAAARAALEDAKLFLKTLNTVTDPTDRTRIRGLMGKDGLPTPEAWEALNIAPKTETTKAQSPLGKLFADKELAIKSGAPEEVLQKYDKKIAEQLTTVTEPQIIQKYGQTFAYMPGSKGLHILKDSRKDMEMKAAYTNWRDLNSALIRMQAQGAGPVELTEMTRKVRLARQQLEAMIEPTDIPVPTLPSPAVPAPAPAAPTPKSAQPIPVPPGLMPGQSSQPATPAPQDNKDPMGLFK